MSSTHQIGSGQSSPFIPSTSLIAASLSGLKAALNSTIANSGFWNFFDLNQNFFRNSHQQ